ncbi:MAG: hypothetical protein AAF734_08820, partial [Bacteroidota bacterium]
MKKILFSVLLLSLFTHCNILQSKEAKIQGVWKVDDVKLPAPIMFTLAMGLKVVPGADLALKYAPVAVKERLENEIKNHYLKANFDFQEAHKLSLKVADYQITDGKWQLKE